MKRRNVTLTIEEIQSVKDQLDRKIVRDFDMSERKLIRYALLNIGSILDIAERKDTILAIIEGQLTHIGGMVETAMDKTVELAKETRGRPKRANAKPTPEDELDAGKLICEELNGVVQNGLCLYKKYEIGPSGKAQRPYEVGVALAALTEAHIDDQYFPTKAAYEEAELKNNNVA